MIECCWAKKSSGEAVVAPSLTESSLCVVIAVLLLLLKPEENKEVMVQRGLRDFGERGILVCCGTAAAVGVVCCGVLWSVVVWCGVSCGVIGESMCAPVCVGMGRGDDGFDKSRRLFRISTREFASSQVRICITIISRSGEK